MSLRAVASRPNTTVIGTTPPVLPQNGQLWWNTDDVKLYFWDGGQWVVAVNMPEVTGGTGTGGIPEAPSDGRNYMRNGQLANWQASPRDSFVNVLDYGARGDGTTDDTAAIQNVLNAHAGTAVVFIPNTGQPYMAINLFIPSGTNLLLEGTIKSRPNAGTLFWVQAGARNIDIHGNGTLDGDGANQDAAVVTVQATLNITGSSNIRVSGITLQNALNWNLNVTSSSRVIVDGVSMLRGGSANEFATTCDDCWLMNCLVDGPDADNGFSFYGGVTNSGIIGCTIRNAAVADHAGDAGIFVLSDSAQPAVCRNILIANNIVYNSDGAGIAVDLAAPGMHEAVTITGNRVYDNNAIGVAQQAQIFVGGVTACVISNNIVSASDPTNTSAYGIRVHGGPAGASGVTVTGNFIFDMGNNTQPGFGVWVDNPSVVLVDGNIFHDYRPTGYMTAIGGVAGPANTFSNNLFGALAAGQAITVTTQPDTIIANGGGGEWAIRSGTLAVSAPVQYTNANGFPRWFVGNQFNPETGNNTGSDFAFYSVNDDGTPLLGAPLTINRASGVVDFAVPPTVGGVPIAAVMPASVEALNARVSALEARMAAVTGGNP